MKKKQRKTKYRSLWERIAMHFAMHVTLIDSFHSFFNTTGIIHAARSFVRSLVRTSTSNVIKSCILFSRFWFRAVSALILWNTAEIKVELNAACVAINMQHCLLFGPIQCFWLIQAWRGMTLHWIALDFIELYCTVSAFIENLSNCVCELYNLLRK